MKKKTLLIILALLLILTMGCGLLGDDDDEEAPVAEEAVSAEEVEPAEVEEPAEPEVEEPTAVPPTEVPPTEAPPTEVPPTPEPTKPAWRMDAPDGSFLVVQDSDNNADWEEIAAMHAANLAIPAPFYYELYVLPSGITFNEVEEHYSAEMSARKYRPARNEQGQNQIYLLTYLHSVDKMSKNAILFYGELSNRDPMVLVIYSNPIE